MMRSEKKDYKHMTINTIKSRHKEDKQDYKD
jgi:hypothetical protein